HSSGQLQNGFTCNTAYGDAMNTNAVSKMETVSNTSSLSKTQKIYKKSSSIKKCNLVTTRPD
ncbi:unnamed protein product, partial [Musa textilis]